ncbi:hypothetical protein BSPP4475_06060 [Brevibacillus aydinogluensis]|jgi:hypothetical protein|uniref:Uncharacterized protein n=1 Tax=Brevibacillus aydinogluensis TaxID=927786 RepID=A0AA48M914_9BACL|nr:hypothetical protein BSPP4475_06060 [Brevibacillus aydinogluensis]
MKYGCLAIILIGVCVLAYAALKAWDNFGEIYNTHF